MQFIRIVAASIAAMFALAVAVNGALAQTAPAGDAGKPLALLAGLRPPHETRSHVRANMHAHAATTHQSAKKHAIKKLAARSRAKLAAKTPSAATQAAPQAQPAQAALPENIWPAADTAPPTATATAAPVQPAPAADDPAPSSVMVSGQTVPIAAPDQVNELDLAADNNTDAAPAATRGDRAGTDTPAAQTVLAAPFHEPTGQVGSASWIAQLLAALGGAAAAGAVAWFLIGSGPIRLYG